MMNTLGKGAALIIKQVVKTCKNVGLRVGNEQLGKVLPSVAVDVICGFTDEGVDALYRGLFAGRPEEEVRRDIQQLGVADPKETIDETWRVVGQEMPTATAKEKAAVVAIVSTIRDNVNQRLEPPNARGESVLRSDVRLRSAADLRELLKKPVELAPGEVIAGRFEIVGRIAAGGMGVVYVATDRELNEEVILKTVRPEMARQKQFLERLKAECQLARGLSHPNIVRIHDYFPADKRGVPFITMERLPGTTLDAWAAQLGRAVTLTEFHDIMKGACAALACAHAPQRGRVHGVLHLDLKPANIMVAADLSSVVVLDFGLGKARSPDRILVTNVGGTFGYMAPEQVRGDGVDERADVYSLGIIAYQLLTGDLPAAGSNSVNDERADVPGALSDAIAAAMAYKVEKRIPSVRALWERVRAGMAEKAPPKGTAAAAPITVPAQAKVIVPPPPKIIAPPRTIKTGAGGTLIRINAGTFTMGSPDGEPERSTDEVPHKVTLTRPFYLGETPVTQAEWVAIMGSNPSHFKGDTLPVESVIFDEAIDFLKKLSERDKAILGAGKRYRLATEAEWEYACRAGTTTPFSFGDTITTDQANWNGNYPYNNGPKGTYREKTTPVKSFPANPWDLYDMHGNVWEWCSDWYGPYTAGAATNPAGVSEADAKVLEGKDDKGKVWWKDKARVVRGGSWCYGARWCRSAFRYWAAPGGRYYDIGLRIALDSD